jgi:menaquinone-dependent protoporphyrinogen IX oxidase
MNRIIVLYATREGHTARIASDLRIHGFEAEEHELRNPLLDPDLHG